MHNVGNLPDCDPLAHALDILKVDVDRVKSGGLYLREILIELLNLLGKLVFDDEGKRGALSPF